MSQSQPLDLTEFMRLKYEATDMLVFYHSQESPLKMRGMPSKIRRAYVEHHSIKGDKVLDGKPIQDKFIRELTAAMQESVTTSATIKNLMPSNVLFHDTRPGKHIVAWWEPAGKKLLHFVKSEGWKENYTIPMPDLLFLANGDTLYVYALQLEILQGKDKGKRFRPSLSTVLYDAPMCNIYADGRVCMGDAICPEDVEDLQELITSWSRAFWMAKFTRPMSTRKGLQKLYTELQGKKSFPVKLLTKCANKPTIKHLLAEL